MTKVYRIHPSIGVARVGDSTDSFYLAPLTVGGLPIDCDDAGNPAVVDGEPQPVESFRDSQGRIRRQGARFRIFVYDDDCRQGRLVSIADPDVVSVEWTVHVANKKSAWYNFTELYGNTMPQFGGQTNSYQNRGVGLRNDSEDYRTREERQTLLTDPGPRTLTLDPRQPANALKVAFSKDTVPEGYDHASFPGADLPPFPVDSLGDMLINDNGELVVMGGYGNAAGSGSITSFAGADQFWDDISDGPVTCRLTLADDPENPIELRAWVIVGATKVAPELVNISTLEDVIYDMAVRFKKLDPDLYDEARFPGTAGWNPDYVVDYDRHIAPLLERMDDYQWVANVQPMTAFARPRFDPRDASEATAAQRQAFFGYFRRPGGLGRPSQYNELTNGNPEEPDLPLMPLNSGTNSVMNTPPEVEIEKFATLTATQYFLLEQWAAGKFEVGRGDAPEAAGVRTWPADRVDVGNSVGLPMSPGIEVTWSTWNPRIYEDLEPYSILPQLDADYWADGLDPSRDETEGGGCQPGDLTKRMAIPWQSDFFECTVQQINYTDPEINKTSQGIPLPPSFYAYWWPPQSPMFVLSGAWSAAEQLAAGVSSGQQVQFNRGIGSFTQMIKAWRYTGFIVNLTKGELARTYPFYAERERREDQFGQSSTAAANLLSYDTGDGEVYNPAWFLKNPLLPTLPLRAGSPEIYDTDPWTPAYTQKPPKEDSSE